MTKEEKAHLEGTRGNKAAEILNSELYQEAVTAIKGELYHALESTNFKETDERDEIWRKLQTLRWFEKYFQQVLETGKLGRKTLGLLDRFKR